MVACKLCYRQNPITKIVNHFVENGTSPKEKCGGKRQIENIEECKHSTDALAVNESH